AGPWQRWIEIKLRSCWQDEKITGRRGCELLAKLSERRTVAFRYKEVIVWVGTNETGEFVGRGRDDQRRYRVCRINSPLAQAVAENRRELFQVIELGGGHDDSHPVEGHAVRAACARFAHDDIAR